VNVYVERNREKIRMYRSEIQKTLNGAIIPKMKRKM
jgi:hypothetical protein